MNKKINNKPMRNKKQELESVFVIEKNVDIPKKHVGREVNPYLTKLSDQLLKMLPKDRIKLSKALLEKLDVSEASFRSMVSGNENLKGRFTIRNFMNMNKEVVETSIYCLAEESIGLV